MRELVAADYDGWVVVESDQSPHPAESAMLNGWTVQKVLAAKLRKGPAEGLKAFFALWRQIVTDTEFHAGCPVLAVAIEETADSQALAAAAEAFRTWSGQLKLSLQDHGVAESRARSLAQLVVAAAEGAVAMCRAQRSVEPLDDVANELTALLESAIAART